MKLQIMKKRSVINQIINFRRRILTKKMKGKKVLSIAQYISDS